ncbi:hypothetical protein FOVG_17037 [Fusarium oxysporum f. sp. pisi HDV247]|uniref:Uncharacterized protein n=2 Tax=Fusarium oxysporum TaxID=5507 RepID=X0KZK0_FUSOX|nr:hypothetical protein FOVG_17037 [Fusarium oxysporum f. sp. pisi HDV247]EXM14222.1 hypothetical protein FOTG_17359 [Fusarium oxysporum f. sp. vasinfectum 25433]
MHAQLWRYEISGDYFLLHQCHAVGVETRLSVHELARYKL